MNQIIGVEKVCIIYGFQKTSLNLYFTGEFQECDVICTPLGHMKHPFFSHAIYYPVKNAQLTPESKLKTHVQLPACKGSFQEQGCFNGQLNQKLNIQTALM